MATSYTSLLGLALPVTGELSGTWGDTVNNSITSLLDTAVAGTTTVSADTTLTTTSGAANQARSAIILASGHVANITITAPAQSKIYTVINTSGTYTVTFRGVGPTTGITLGANEKALLAWNGSDFVRIGGSGGSGVFSSITNTSLTSGRVVYSTTGGLETDSANLLFNGTTLTANTLNLTNALGTSYGGTGLTSFTSGGVVYASSSSALTTGSALTFDGNQVSIGTGAAQSVNTINGGTTGGAIKGQRSGVNQWFVGDTASALGSGTGLINFVYNNDPFIWSYAGSELMRLTSTSLYTASGINVGIGTSSPSYTVQAVGATNGRIQVEGTSGYGMVFVQGSSGNSAQLQLNSNGGSGRRYSVVSDSSGNFVISDETAASARVTINSSGNLGIGTSSPGQKLSVVGDGNFSRSTVTDTFIQASNSVATFNITQSANGSTYLYNYGAYNLYFGTGASTKMTLDSSGNLGIGTSSPARKLDVAATMRIADGSSVEWGGISLYIAGTSNTLLFATSSSERMRLDSSGNLGVGVTPSSWSTLKPVQLPGGSLAGYAGGAGNNQLGLYNNAYFDGSNYKYVTTDTAQRFLTIAGEYRWYNAPSGTAGNAISFTQAMTLDASGNLGIGVTAPDVKLRVDSASPTRGIVATFRGTGSTGSQIAVPQDGIADWAFGQPAGVNAFAFWAGRSAGANGTEAMRLDSSGNLGIGTSSPTAKLDVRGTLYQQVSSNPTNAVAAIITNQTTVSNNGVRLQFDVYNIGSAGLGVPSDSAALAFYSGGITTERMRLDSSGNLIVGGTSAALGLVSVQGTGNYNAISAETSSATSTDFAKIILRKTSTPPNSSLYAAYNGAVDFYSKAQNGASGISGRILNFAYSVNSDTTVCVGNTRVSAFGTSSTLGEYALAELRLGSGTTGVAQIYCFDGSAEVQSTETRYDYFRPGQDNYSTLGASGRRWTTVYATTGTINTSDRNDKQDIEELSAAEQRVAVRVKGLIRKFRFKDSVAAKGDNARIHFGVIAQDVQDAFTAEGLDASRYGLFCSDTFKAIDGKAVEKDENGQYPEGAIDYTRLGVRYEELLAFVISAI